jgi:hypothetical protein
MVWKWQCVAADHVAKDDYDMLEVEFVFRFLYFLTSIQHSFDSLFNKGVFRFEFYERFFQATYENMNMEMFLILCVERSCGSNPLLFEHFSHIPFHNIDKIFSFFCNQRYSFRDKFIRNYTTHKYENKIKSEDQLIYVIGFLSYTKPVLI